MDYKVLGNTGVLLSRVTFGTMTFGGEGIWTNIGRTQQEEANQLIKFCVDKGINSIDTANAYSFGQSETILGNAIHQLGIPRQDLFIATKVLARMGPSVNNVGLSRYHIMASVEESLKRLQLSHIDLLYVHGVDPLTPTEEVMRTLNDVVNSGKVRYIGVCNWPAWMVMKANGIADKNGWHKFVAMQYFYSAVARDVEREILPLAEDQNLGFLPWSPLAGGFLSGKFTRANQNTGGAARRDNFDFPPIDKEKAYDIVEAIEPIAKSRKVSVAQIALAWVMVQERVTSTIIGAKNIQQLEENIIASDLSFGITVGEMAEINKVATFAKEYPQWMIERQRQHRQ